MKKYVLNFFCLLTFIFISQFSFANNNLNIIAINNSQAIILKDNKFEIK